MQKTPFPKMCGLCFLPFHVFLVNCSNYYVEPGKGGILYISTQAHLFVDASGGYHIRKCETAARATQPTPSRAFAVAPSSASGASASSAGPTRPRTNEKSAGVSLPRVYKVAIIYTVFDTSRRGAFRRGPCNNHVAAPPPLAINTAVNTRRRRAGA